MVISMAFRFNTNTSLAHLAALGRAVYFDKLALNISNLLLAFVLFVTIGACVSAGTQAPSAFEPHVPPEPNLSDLPRDFAFSVYTSAVARIRFQAGESAVEPLYYLAETDPEFADLQNALAAAIFFTQAMHRNRAEMYSSRAVALKPNMAVFEVTRVLSDPSMSQMSRDGSMFLTTEAAESLDITQKRLAIGSPNQRKLAEILRTIKREGKNSVYPYFFAGYIRLLSNPGLLFTSPSKRAFEKLEAKVNSHLESLEVDASKAKGKYETARRILENSRKKWDGASLEERKLIREESVKWRKEIEQSINIVKIAENLFNRYEAFISNDWEKLKDLRIQQESDFNTAIAEGPKQWITDQEVQHPVTFTHETFGRYFAVVIGNNHYPHPKMSNLRTAVRDAEAVASILRVEYGYQVVPLINASRDEIYDTLTSLRKKLTQKDNILIYYAGHGNIDRDADQGYWLPVDAGDTAANWVSNSDINDLVRGIKAKHTLIIADSCYSGTLSTTRGVSIHLPVHDYIQRVVNSRVGLVITSGSDDEPVYDGDDPNGHSVFARELLEVLRDNKGILEAYELFLKVKKRMKYKLGDDQVPTIGFIKGLHEPDADYLFVKRR